MQLYWRIEGRMCMLDAIMMYPKAFVVGGILCAIGQFLIMKTKLTSARILVGYVTAGVIFGALGLYKPLIDFAGAGATTPLSGFGYTLSHGAMEAAKSEGILGLLQVALLQPQAASLPQYS